MQVMEGRVKTKIKRVHRQRDFSTDAHGWARMKGYKGEVTTSYVSITS